MTKQKHNQKTIAKTEIQEQFRDYCEVENLIWEIQAQTVDQTSKIINEKIQSGRVTLNFVYLLIEKCRKYKLRQNLALSSLLSVLVSLYPKYSKFASLKSSWINFDDMNFSKIEFSIIDDNVSELVDFFQNSDHKEVESTRTQEWLNLACAHGSIKCFKFLTSHGAKISEESARKAALGGNLELIQAVDSMKGNLKGAHVEAILAHNNSILDWLTSKYDWTEDVIPATLVFNGNFTVFNYFVANKIGLDRKPQLLVDFAVHINDYTLTKYCFKTLKLTKPTQGAEFALIDDSEEFNPEGKYNALLEAVNNESTDCIKSLVEHAFDVNADSENSLLAYALKNDKPKAASALLEHGVDVNRIYKDANGEEYPILVLAILKDQPEILTEMINKGAKVNEFPQMSPLLYAVQAKNQKMVEILINNGAEQGPSHGNQTPLTMAASNGSNAILQFLLEHGGDVNENFTITPLGAAIEAGNLECVKTLIHAGADPKLSYNMPDKQKNVKPVEHAHFKSFSEIEKVIDAAIKSAKSPRVAKLNVPKGDSEKDSDSEKPALLPPPPPSQPSETDPKVMPLHSPKNRGKGTRVAKLNMPQKSTREAKLNAPFEVILAQQIKRAQKEKEEAHANSIKEDLIQPVPIPAPAKGDKDAERLLDIKLVYPTDAVDLHYLEFLVNKGIIKGIQIKPHDD